MPTSLEPSFWHDAGLSRRTFTACPVNVEKLPFNLNGPPHWIEAWATTPYLPSGPLAAGCPQGLRGTPLSGQVPSAATRQTWAVQALDIRPQRAGKAAGWRAVTRRGPAGRDGAGVGQSARHHPCRRAHWQSQFRLDRGSARHVRRSRPRGNHSLGGDPRSTGSQPHVPNGSDLPAAGRESRIALAAADMYYEAISGLRRRRRPYSTASNSLRNHQKQAS